MATPTISEINQGIKLFGVFSAQITDVPAPRTVNTKNGPKSILDLTVSDGTGSIGVAIWSPQQQFKVGQTINITNAYTKEYNNVISIAMSQKSTITLSGTLNGTVYPPTAPVGAAPIMALPSAPIDPNEPIYIPMVEIEKLIMVEKSIETPEVLDMLVNKHNAGGLLERMDALIIIAKLAGLEDKIIEKTKDPLPYSEMTKDELLVAFKETTHPATRGLIDKVLMHKEKMHLKRIELRMKNVELKLIAKINKISDDYEKIRDMKVEEIIPKEEKDKSNDPMDEFFAVDDE